MENKKKKYFQILAYNDDLETWESANDIIENNLFSERFIAVDEMRDAERNYPNVLLKVVEII